MKPEILLIHGFPPLEARLSERFVLRRLTDFPDAKACFAAHGETIRAIVTHAAGPQLDADFIARLPRLEMIANIGAGYETIDIETAKARGIVVTNAGGVNAVDVAEFAFGLLLDVVRGLSFGDRRVREGQWADWSTPPRQRASGRPLGILGLGHIGLEVAKRAEAFAMPVAYHNRRKREDVSYRYVADAPTLAREVDFLLVALPGGDATRHLVGGTILDALGPQGFLINIGRGSVVDEAALIAALSDGRLGGAALDVLEHEPQVPPALLALPNVVITPHQAGMTPQSHGAALELAVRNLEAHFDGRPVLTPVT